LISMLNYDIIDQKGANISKDGTSNHMIIGDPDDHTPDEGSGY